MTNWNLFENESGHESKSPDGALRRRTMLQPGMGKGMVLTQLSDLSVASDNARFYHPLRRRGCWRVVMLSLGCWGRGE
jgi:hypothetical protein